MTAVPPAVAVSTVVVLGAGGSEMPHLVAGVAAHPGLKVSWAIDTDVSDVATHGTKVVHVDDWGVEGSIGGYCSVGEPGVRETAMDMVGEQGRTVSEEKVRA